MIMEEARRLDNTLQLCYLAVCLVVPIAISEAATALFDQIPLEYYPNGLKTIESQYRHSVISIVGNLSGMVAHSMSFYWYMVLSSQFRKNFLKRIFRR